MPQPCKFHPEHLAHKRCYGCKEYICSQCVSLAYHHYFCGLKCKIIHLLKNSFSILNPRFSPSIATKYVHSKPGKKSFLNMLTSDRLAIIAIILINFALFFYLTNRVSNIDGRIERIETAILLLERYQQEQPDKMSLDSTGAFPAVDSVTNKVTFSGNISIYGRAGEKYLLTLLVNGDLQAAKKASKGVFEFEHVSLQPGNNDISIKAIAPDNSLINVEDFVVMYYFPKEKSITKDLLRGRQSVPMVALTFDGGSTDNGAGKILDVLKEKRVRATMFLSGLFIERYPEMVRRIVADGHEVGNHTYSHMNLTTYTQDSTHNTLPEVTFEKFQKELIDTNSLFREVTGSSMIPFWRAPFGEQNEELRLGAAYAGYRHVSWTFDPVELKSMDSHDWVTDKESHLYKTAEEIKDYLLDFGENDPNGANGAVILMHLGTDRKEEFLYEVLPSIIDGFREKGYRLSTISELIREEIATSVK